MAAVPRFYAKVLADPLVSPMFDNLDMEAQSQKQLSFLSRAFGGAQEHQGRDLRTAHARLVNEHGLSDAHFDRIVTLLDDTLEEIGVAAELRQEVWALVDSTRTEVLNR